MMIIEKQLTSYLKAESNRNSLIYYLSDSFNEKDKNGNLKYSLEKKATYDSVASINKTFKEINMPFNIELREPKGIKAGDLRYNLINLVTDPSKHSTLGYGPTVKNPDTGEIIHGLVNMYYGTFRSLVPEIYRHMVEVSKHLFREDTLAFSKKNKKVKKLVAESENQ